MHVIILNEICEVLGNIRTNVMALEQSPDNRKELEAELQRLRQDLADLEETIGFNLLNTSAHISGRQVRKDEESLSALRERIAGITRLLQARQQ